MRSLLIAFALIFSTVAMAALDEGSPFTNVAFDEGGNIQVEYDGKSYYLVSIDKVPIGTIVEACTALYAESCAAMFTLNFTETLAALALPGTDWDQQGALAEVDLELYVFQTHQVITVEGAPVTPENRKQILINLTQKVN